MTLRIANYHLTCKQTLFAAVTLTGGVMVKRHWEAANQPGASKWGHRVIALIEATPVLGALAALVEWVVTKFFFKVSREEASKVRSLCLELLCNLRDLQFSARLQFEAQYFLTDKISTRKIGFLEYGLFLNYLGRLEDEKYELNADNRLVLNRILNRHRDLISLQGKRVTKRVTLCCKIKGLFSRSQKHSTQNKLKKTKQKLLSLVRYGLFNRTFIETLDKAKALGLNPMPALPSRQTIVNLYPMWDAINYLQDDYAEAGKLLMLSTRIFTFKELCQSIKLSCEKIKEKILSWDRYSILVEPRHSQAWMADLAYRFLPAEKLPEKLIAFHFHNILVETWKQALEHTDNLIIFDDGIYTGTQLTTILQELAIALMQNNLRNKHVIIVVGFCPRDFTIDSSYEKATYNLTLEVITSCFTDSSVKRLMANHNHSEQLKKAALALAQENNHCIVTEWKTPDGLSTPMYVTEATSGHFNKMLKSNNTTVATLNGGLPPITKIHPPYHYQNSSAFF